MPYKVLIVDDEPIIRHGLSASVDWEKEGLVLAGQAANGEAALQAIRELGADIVITDIKMPIMDGLELVRRAKELVPHLAAVLVSSYNEFEYAREAVKLGVVVDYLLKPTMEPEDLARILRQCKQRLAEYERAQSQGERLVVGERQLQAGRFAALLRAYAAGAAELAELARGAAPDWFGEPLAVAVWRPELPPDAAGQPEHLPGRSAERPLRLPEAALAAELEAAAAALGEWLSEPDGRGRGAAVVAGGELLVLLADRGSAYGELTAWRQRLSAQGRPFTVGVSPPFSQPSSLPDAIEWARAALRQSFFDGVGRCYAGKIAARREDGAHGPTVSADERDREADRQAANIVEAFSRAVASGDRAECAAALERMAELWRRLRPPQPAIAARAHSLAIMMWSRHSRPMAEERVAGMMAKLAHIDGARTLPQLVGLLAAELDALWEPGQLQLAVDDAGGAHAIQLALSYIQERFRHDITLQEAADHVHMSKNYFSEQFKRRTGLNFIDYVIRLRIEYAKQLLESTGLRVGEIGGRSGFNSPKHFLKLFKRLTGCTPAEYRARAASANEGEERR